MTRGRRRGSGEIVVHRPGAGICVVLDEQGHETLVVRCSLMRLGPAALTERLALSGCQEALELRDALARWRRSVEREEEA
ncbi:MAG: hypothetical protein ICV69_10745 [Thermoleophilaceae bacterium]|nr:hypothetical protein [Thermoleophilaceae bacterium]